MDAAIVGWVVIVIGLIALLAGVGGGIATMFKKITSEANEGAAALAGLPTGLIDSLVKFLEALIKAPVWLALVVIGILLVAWGGTMI